VQSTGQKKERKKENRLQREIGRRKIEKERVGKGEEVRKKAWRKTIRNK